MKNMDKEDPEEMDLAFCQLAMKQGFLSIKLFKECCVAHAEIKRMGLKKPTLREVVLSKAKMKPEQVTEIMAVVGARSGKRSIEGYKLLKKIASGGFGSIYKAKQESMDRVVALKVLPRRLALNHMYVKNFMRETKLAAKLAHENIVYILDAGQSAGLLYLAMEYVEGETLDSIIRRRGPMLEKPILAIIWALANALSHAHRTGILHRDVKPANVIMQAEKTPKLCDFGLAKSTARQAMMESSAVVGTPTYMAPEQILGEKVDKRTDVYCLGATTYFMATAAAPFPESGNIQELYDHHIKRPLLPPRQANPNVSPKIERIIRKMMHREREKRYPSADEVIEAILQIARESKTSLGPGPRKPPAAPKGSDS